MHSHAQAFLTQPPYRGKLMRKWLTRPSLHRPTATPSDICSYYAKLALSHSLSCVVCLLLFLYLRPSPHFGTTLQTTFSPLSFGKNFMKIRSAVPENGCLVFCGERKKSKKQKTSVKHIHIRLIGGCVKQYWVQTALSLIVFKYLHQQSHV